LSHVELTKKEAIRFHNWLSDDAISQHKWEIMEDLDKIVGHCPHENRCRYCGEIPEHCECSRGRSS